MSARVTVFRDIAAREARRISTEERVRIANQIAVEAQAAAPVLTGQYRNGIHVETSGDDVSVVDDDPTAIHKEYGTVDTPAHAVLTDAARRHGRYSGMQPKRGRRA
jgi:hypothetical protein